MFLRFLSNFSNLVYLFQKPLRQKSKIHPVYGARQAVLYCILAENIFFIFDFPGKIEFYKNTIIIQQIWGKTIVNKNNLQELTQVKLWSKAFFLYLFPFQIYKIKTTIALFKASTSDCSNSSSLVASLSYIDHS